MPDDDYFAKKLKGLTREQVQKVIDLVNFEDLRFDAAVQKAISGEA